MLFSLALWGILLVFSWWIASLSIAAKMNEPWPDVYESVCCSIISLQLLNRSCPIIFLFSSVPSNICDSFDFRHPVNFCLRRTVNTLIFYCINVHLWRFFSVLSHISFGQHFLCNAVLMFLDILLSACLHVPLSSPRRNINNNVSEFASWMFVLTIVLAFPTNIEHLLVSLRLWSHVFTIIWFINFWDWFLSLSVQLVYQL